MRNQLDRYTAPNRVDWHFANINNRWTKRALVSAGFGYPSPVDTDSSFERWKPIFSVAEMGGADSAAAAAESRLEKRRNRDIETGRSMSQPRDHITSHSVSSASSEDFDKDIARTKAYEQSKSRVIVVHGLNRPLFHIDLTSALQSAIANVEGRGEAREVDVGLKDRVV